MDSDDLGATRMETDGASGALGATRAEVDGTARAAASPGVTRVEIAPPEPFRQLWKLPPELESQYVAVEDLSGGNQGHVIRARRLRDGLDVAVKVSGPGVQIDHAVLERLTHLPLAHIVEIYDHGAGPGYDWEVLEYVPGGSLASLLAEEGPELRGERVAEILDELASAIEALHAQTPIIVHNDLKPENVLVRTREPRLDLVLTDFGTTRAIAGTSMIGDRIVTLPYASPEAVAGQSSPARDWWAVGMIVAEALLGRHPLLPAGADELQEGVVRVALNTLDVPLDGIADERWRQLCRGLLTRNPRLRWSSEQVRDWQRGGMPPVHREEERTAPGVPPLRFAGADVASPRALASALAGNWPGGISLLASNRDASGGEHARAGLPFVRLREWLETHDCKRALQVLRQDDPFARSGQYGRQLFRLIAALDSSIRPGYAGHPVDRAGLAALAAAAIGSDVDRSLLETLHEQGIIGEVAQTDGHRDLADVEDHWERHRAAIRALRDSDGLPEGFLSDDGALAAAYARALLVTLDGGVAETLLEASAEAATVLGAIDWYAEAFAPRDDDEEAVARAVVGLAAAPQARRELEEERERRRAALWRSDRRIALGSAALAACGALPATLGYGVQSALGFPRSEITSGWPSGAAAPLAFAPLWSLGAGLLLVTGAAALVLRGNRALRQRGTRIGALWAMLGTAALVATPFVNTMVQRRLFDQALNSPACISDDDTASYQHDGVRSALVPNSTCSQLARVTPDQRFWTIEMSPGATIVRLARTPDVAIVGARTASRNFALAVDVRTGRRLWSFQCRRMNPTVDSFAFSPNAWHTRTVVVSCHAGDMHLNARTGKGRFRR